MQLKVARMDQGFIAFQEKMYSDLLEDTRKKMNASYKIKDVDLMDHKKQLEKKSIARKNTDWNVFPLTSITEGCDFVTDLLQKYLDEIRVRSRDEMFGDKIPPSTLLRKNVRLGDINNIIDELSDKTVVLKNKAEAYAKKIAEEKRLKEIADNIRRLTKRKLDFQHREAYKRSGSYKGRVRVPVIYPDE